MHEKIPYEYKNLPIPGGGYVTGFLFSKKEAGTLYIRTDIGGTYRFHREDMRWHSLSTHVSMRDLSETYPAALALDETAPGTLYIACGTDGRPEGTLAISQDYGKSFVCRTIPTPVHGNWNGRGTGLRLLADPSDTRTLYYASQRGGLLCTKDLGETWQKLDVNGEEQMTLVWVSEDGSTIVAGTAGLTGRTAHVRGQSLYVSYDRGNSFEPVPMPVNRDIPDSRLAGLVPQRYDYDGTFLYITLSVTGRRSYVAENGYSCDSGDAIGGRVLRYSFDKDRRITGYTDITPVSAEESFLEFGFSGITSCQAKPGLLACSTICREEGDMIFLSLDYGNTWTPKLFDLEIGRMEFRAPYMYPECNGGHNLIHWLSDIKCNPFDPDELWFNSGTGVFVSRNFTEDTAVFSDWCDGLEETVHLNIYSLPSGDVQVVDILGDLGGFAFTDLDTPCSNSFADEKGNRYITCINADFSDFSPETVIVTPRGNWTGKTKGGLILSKDQCRTFERLPMPFGLTKTIDRLLHNIEKPNVNSGWVAMSPDCQNIVWSVADGILLPADAVIHSSNGGKTFSPVKIYDTKGRLIQPGIFSPGQTIVPLCLFKVFSDRVNSSLMYGFGENSRIYVSRDKGTSFYEKVLPAGFPKVNFGLIDCADKTEIRAESGREGILYLALREHGLWKMVYDRNEDTLLFSRITQPGDTVCRVGLGLLREGEDYCREDKAFYICGTLDGEYGFFRSLDQGRTWQRLNDDTQMFGDIHSIDGDCRTFGRFYLATGSLGAIYGQMAP